uniref:TrkH family potassium uptake protein n=1 Tax=Agathobacter sp. TaxID=2021311 RepID=UPI0040577E2B
MKKKWNVNLSTTQIIMLSFIGVIWMGSILLALPISSATGKAVPYVDALFTATTATCVTGLVTLPTVTTWSVFGQVVILVLIQIGGLGVVTIMSALMMIMNRRIGIADRMLIQDAFNLNTLSGLVKFVRKVLVGTFLIEGTGAVLYMFVFIPEFGLKGIWISVFNAISAFCNAGIDIISENSLCDYAANPLINIVTSLLIILGGIGYVVWWDVLRVLGDAKTMKRRCFKKLTLHSKIAISVTVVLIAVGALAVLVFEYNNPLTLKGYSFFDKVQISLFQSVTLRTAGFATIPQQDLTNPTAFVSLVLMFIGGSPVGTAGGMKTVTLAVLVLSTIASVTNKDEVTIFNRNISKEAISKSIAVFSMSFAIMFGSALLLSAVTDADALDIVYETVSAAATVGLTRNLTPFLNVWGKLIIIATMYLGRVGPISLAIAFNMRKENQNMIKNPTEKISVG